MSEGHQDEGAERFFSEKKRAKPKRGSTGSATGGDGVGGGQGGGGGGAGGAGEDGGSGGGDNSLQSMESDEHAHNTCLTLRVLQYILPFLRNKGVWEPSQGDVFKSHDAEEAKYPRTLRILESPLFDAIFVTSCLLSIFLFLFSEGFLLESRLLWGIIHLVNAIYALGLFCQWLQILIKSKYAKTNHGYTTKDIVYTLISVFPADLIVLVIYTLNDEDDNEDNEVANPIEHWMITVSRLNYFLRIRSIRQYFQKWEEHLVVGDFVMFILRTTLFTTFLIHMFACIWHRLACRSFRLKHFLMTPDEATTEICEEISWMGLLKSDEELRHPLLDHPNWHVLWTHYLVSVYWTIIATFRLGAADIRTTLVKNGEVAFVVATEIVAWIFVLVTINGQLASLFIEKDAEKERFLQRCFAIRQYLGMFGERVGREVREEVGRFYNYLWRKSKGIVSVDLVDVMPFAMKSEVFYDVNKFVMDQLPMLKGLEEPFLMSLSVHTSHKFFLEGELLFRKGETANAMYYLVKGHLEVMSEDDGHPITTIRSGSIIGEIHLLQPYPHIATVRCGSDCDVLVLSRKHFRRVLNVYPQFIGNLEQRLENRLEQSGLLLALCEKHNTYHKAFKALREGLNESDFREGDFYRSDLGHDFENVTKILAGGMDGGRAGSGRNTDEDFDGLEISGEMETQINKLAEHSNAENLTKKTFEEILATAYLALETDVARAGSLATDLNIPRPPLIVTAPESNIHVTLGFNQEGTKENVFVMLFKFLREPSESRGNTEFVWKGIVSVCALSVFWYYPYQFAFRGRNHLGENIFHGMDIIFAVDFFYDMIQVVVTPQKTFESFKEILVYRLKTCYFYMRLLSWIPLEYIVASTVGIPGEGHVRNPYFYLCKFNRLLEVHLVFPFLANLETRLYISPVLMVLGRLALGVFFVAHIFTVLFKFVIRDVILTDPENEMTYRHAFYRALVVTTAVGYGDMRSATSLELLVEVLGLIVGVSVLIYLQAKVTAMLVNKERKRVSFQQMYYSLEEFMSQRKFPKGLRKRVNDYYRLQWRAHEGTLIVRERQIWDAPKSLLAKVSMAVGHKYIKRIPLFMHCPLQLQTDFCLALNHYMIPPGETLLYPEDLVRDLYIISKGYVEVIRKNKRVGVFTEGRYFGLSGLLFSVNTDYMFRTLTHCQILCLPYESFLKVTNSNANFQQEISQLVKEGMPKPAGQGTPSKSPSKDTTVTASKKKKAKSKSPSKTTEATPPEGGAGAVPEEDRLKYPSKKFLQKVLDESPVVIASSEELSQEDLAAGVTSKAPLGPAQGTKKGPLRFLQSLKCLHPNGKFLRSWITFRIICAVLITIYAPVQMVFPIDPKISFVVTLIFDIVAWTDILLRTRIAYLGSQEQLITASKQMTWNYLRGNFLLDILACFPADMIAFFVLVGFSKFGNHYRLISVLRLNRMFQGINLFMANSILEKTMYKRLSLIMLLEMFPIMLLFINMVTCFSILPVCLPTKTGLPNQCENQEAWVLNGLMFLKQQNRSQSDGDLRDISGSYLTGLFWVIQTVFCVGVGDFFIEASPANQITAILVTFLGIMIITYVGSKLTSCIVGENPAKLQLQEKMSIMNDFLEQHRVSKNSRRRVREVYLNQWKKNNGIDSPANLFQALPPTLKTDVLKQLYGQLLRSSPLFENCDGAGIRMLASTLTEIYYSEGEFLMKFGDLCDDVYFIAGGAVTCYNVRGDIMSHLGGGSIIGEIAPFFHTHRLYTAVAVKGVTAFVWRKEHFLGFLDQYPEIRRVVKGASVKHYKELLVAGNRKIGSLEMDVIVKFENEQKVPSKVPSKASKAPSKGPKGDKDRDLSGVSVGGATLDSQMLGLDEVDITRNRLTEEMVKREPLAGGGDEFGKGERSRWWSWWVTFGKLGREEMGLVHVYQEEKKVTCWNFTVHPASQVVGWVSLCLVLVTLSCGITAYEIAFASRHRKTETVLLTVVRYGLEVFFVGRIVGSFHLGFWDDEGELVVDVARIARRYARKVDGLWLDLVTTLPFLVSLVEYGLESVKGEYVRSVQLLRVTLFFRYLRETDSSLKLKSSRSKVLKITILICFIFHFWACAWYLVACTDQCTTGSWMQEVLNQYNQFGGGGRNVSNPSSPDDNVSTASRYLLSLYYVTNALTYTGFAEITARSRIEHGLTVVMIFGTVFVIGYLVGEMVQCLASQVATKIHFQHKLSVLINHFETLGISQGKIDEVRHYFKLLWCRCRGMMFHELMEELPYTLRADVAMEIYGPNIKSSRILGKLDDNLIRQISARIRHEIYFPGSHIVRAGDVCTSMYFIKKGEIVILDGNSNIELCVEILYENECFGEVKILLPREQYRFSYVARLESEVGVLHKEDVEQVLKNHPKIFEELKEKANRVKVRRQSLKEEEDKERGGAGRNSAISLKSGAGMDAGKVK